MSIGANDNFYDSVNVDEYKYYAVEGSSDMNIAFTAS